MNLGRCPRCKRVGPRLPSDYCRDCHNAMQRRYRRAARARKTATRQSVNAARRELMLESVRLVYSGRAGDPERIEQLRRRIVGLKSGKLRVTL